MKTLTYDLCLLVTDKGKEMFGLTRLQTDNIMLIATTAFAQQE
jgi:hypothetical protein